MNKVWMLTSLTVAIFACTDEPKNNDTDKTNQSDSTVMTGNDADEHGCKPSTGYTWSVLKNECIRVWEIGIQMQPINTDSTNAQFIATAILNEDKSKAELFIAEVEGSLILEQSKTATQTYTHSTGYELSIEGQKWELKKNGKTIYIKK